MLNVGNVLIIIIQKYPEPDPSQGVPVCQALHMHIFGQSYKARMKFLNPSNLPHGYAVTINSLIGEDAIINDTHEKSTGK